MWVLEKGSHDIILSVTSHLQIMHCSPLLTDCLMAFCLTYPFHSFSITICFLITMSLFWSSIHYSIKLDNLSNKSLCEINLGPAVWQGKSPLLRIIISWGEAFHNSSGMELNIHFLKCRMTSHIVRYRTDPFWSGSEGQQIPQKVARCSLTLQPTGRATWSSLCWSMSMEHFLCLPVSWIFNTFRIE